MLEKEKKPDKKPFILRCWWGLICTLIFVAGSFTQCGPEKVPSSKFGGPVFLGKIEEGAVFIVSNATDKFRVLVSDGDEFNYDAGQVQEGANRKYRFTVMDNTVKIFDLTPQLSKHEMSALWPHGVGVAMNENETLAVSMAYDIEPMTLSGNYTVDGDRVSDHFFEFGTPVRGLIFTFGVIGLYLLGATVKGIILLVHRRKQRHQTNETE